MSKATHIEYRSVQTGASEWTVFIVDDREPDWWRVIASFSNQKRADSYAEIETMMSEDFKEDEHDTMGDGVFGNVPTVAEPQSNITVGKIVRRESIAHTRIEREETVTLAEPHRQAIAAPVAQEGETVEEEDDEEEEELPDPVDCATLDPLTPIQFKLFSVICNARGQYISGSEMDKQTGHVGMLGNVYGLAKKGYIRARPIGGGRKAYDVLVFGAPRVTGAASAPNPSGANQHTVSVHKHTGNGDIPVTISDASKLEPITEKQGAIFAAVRKICATGDTAYASAISKMTGHSTTEDGLWSLEKKGYVRRLTSGNRKHWEPIADGTPTVENRRDGRGELIRAWTEEEVEGLYDLAPKLGDNYAKYAASIDRTLDAVMQKARTVGCFMASLVPGYVGPDVRAGVQVEEVADEPEPAAENIEEPQGTAVATVEENDDPDFAEVDEPEDDDSDIVEDAPDEIAPANEPRELKPLPAGIDINELGRAKREVLLACLAAGDRASIAQIAPYASIDEDRVGRALTDINALGLVSHAQGKWSLTDAGYSAAMALRMGEAA